MQQRAFLIIATGPVAAFPVLPFCKGEPFSRILCGFVPGGDEFVLLAVADANAVACTHAGLSGRVDLAGQFSQFICSVGWRPVSGLPSGLESSARRCLAII